MGIKARLFSFCILGLQATSTFGFSTDSCSVTRRFNTTSATTNALITVTAALTNGGASALRGFYFVDHIPSGLTVRTIRVTLNGQSISDYTVETGAIGEEYAGCIPYRWIFEVPPGFPQNNSVAPRALAQIDYSLTSAQPGAFSLQQFSWSGFFLGTANASFGCSETADSRTLNFTQGPPPQYPILTLGATTLNFSAVQGANPANQTLGISNGGSGTLNWTAVADSAAPAWLTVSPGSGSGAATLTVAVASASLAPGTYSKNITVTAAGANNSPRTVTVNLTVSGSGTVHYDFTYRDRATLLAAGWSFLARTASGAARNTEQTSGAVVSYDQAAHPGVLRIPADAGDLWSGMNNTRNSLFRNLPANWTSIKLKLAGFAPTQNYQQAGLTAYQDDDNYVYVDRIYNGGQRISSSRDVSGSGSVINSVGVTATTNLYFRLDRGAGNVISAYYSVDGTSWVLSGSVTQALTDPRLGIIVGSSSSGFPNADIAWAEVTAPQAGPVLSVSPASLTFSTPSGANPPNQVISIANGGSGTLNWTAVADTTAPAWLAVSPGSGSGAATLTVTAASASLAPGTYSKNITVTAAGAANSPQTVTVNLTVNSATPVLQVSATTLNFSAVQGANPANQTLGISNGGSGTLNWTAVADSAAPAWLTVSPGSGSGAATLTVAVASASLAPGTYSKNITVTAAGANNSPRTVTVNLTVSGSGTVHYDFTYRDRATLLAAGWSFLARTASGAARNTEQTSGAVVSYDQAAHPGVLRIPADAGDLWSGMNNTRNSLFRNLPANWTSIKLKLAGFAPTQNYQQAGLTAYQDDDNYVYVDRIYNGGQRISSSRDVSGSGSVINSVGVTATTNLYFRLDRGAGNVISAYYSVDGTSWVLSGSVTQALTDPRLGIIVGSSSSGFPNADIAWAEVTAPQAPAFARGSSIALQKPGVSEGHFGFDLPTEAGLSYIVEYKDLLDDPEWTALKTLLGTGNSIRVTDSAAPSKSRFYRVRLH